MGHSTSRAGPVCQQFLAGLDLREVKMQNTGEIDIVWNLAVCTFHLMLLG
jgi:hypothetical protein